MKSSLNSATAVLRGFADWFSGRGDEALPEDSGIPFECGYGAAPQDTQPNDARELAVPRDGWAPGLSLDNFS